MGSVFVGVDPEFVRFSVFGERMCMETKTESEENFNYWNELSHPPFKAIKLSHQELYDEVFKVQ